MPATAAARKTAPRHAARPRRAPRPASARAAAKPAPRRRTASARPAPRLVPVAVGRTALAVGGIADSGIVLRLTRSRLWIGALGSLLVGIVALNVFALSFNASSSKTAALSEELLRENSALRADIENGLSNQRLLQVASRIGLGVPEPGAVLYLDPSARDAALAAERLRKGEVAIGSEYVPPAPPVTPVVPAAETAAEATTDPALVETTTPTETPAVPTEQAPTTPVTPVAGGITAP